MFWVLGGGGGGGGGGGFGVGGGGGGVGVGGGGVGGGGGGGLGGARKKRPLPYCIRAPHLKLVRKRGADPSGEKFLKAKNSLRLKKTGLVEEVKCIVFLT